MASHQKILVDHLKNNILTVCIDANVYISGIAFGGKPLIILNLALARKFYLISSSPIITEVKRNLTKKLKVPESAVDQWLQNLLEVSTLYEPQGDVKFINHAQDNLVLETALLGNANILVTGDKKDLLPLKTFRGISIESPTEFLTRAQLQP